MNAVEKRKKATQAEEARYLAQTEEHENRMLEIYPIGSIWGCNHGTRNGNGCYRVRINHYATRDGFCVDNINTGARKYVTWWSLSEVPQTASIRDTK